MEEVKKFGNILNLIKQKGGALYISDSGISYHFNNTISSNNASIGGALYLEFSAFVTFESSTITNNMAFQEGGGI